MAHLPLNAVAGRAVEILLVGAFLVIAVILASFPAELAAASTHPESLYVGAMFTDAEPVDVAQIPTSELRGPVAWVLDPASSVLRPGGLIGHVNDPASSLVAGPGAASTPNLSSAFPAIQATGAVPVAGKAAAAALTPGVPIGPTPVWVVRHPWPLSGPL